MTDLEALFDAVIVKPQEEEETTYGSIVVPDLGKDRPTIGFTKLEHKGDEFYIGQENQILARLKNTTSIEDVLAETEVTPEEKSILENE